MAAVCGEEAGVDVAEHAVQQKFLQFIKYHKRTPSTGPATRNLKMCPTWPSSMSNAVGQRRGPLWRNGGSKADIRLLVVQRAHYDSLAEYKATIDWLVTKKQEKHPPTDGVEKEEGRDYWTTNFAYYHVKAVEETEATRQLDAMERTLNSRRGSASSAAVSSSWDWMERRGQQPWRMGRTWRPRKARTRWSRFWRALSSRWGWPLPWPSAGQPCWWWEALLLRSHCWPGSRRATNALDLSIEKIDDLTRCLVEGLHKLHEALPTELKVAPAKKTRVQEEEDRLIESMAVAEQGQLVLAK